MRGDSGELTLVVVHLVVCELTVVEMLASVKVREELRRKQEGSRRR